MNGQKIEAKDGVYSFVIEGIENYEVSATFRAKAAEEPTGKKGCGSSVSLTLGIGGGLMVAGAALTAFLAKKKKKN